MIDFYFWPTPNGWKVSIALEEMELPYNVIPVDIGRGAQFEPDFARISPSHRMPAIVDHEPIGGGSPLALAESGAILLYLAEKTGCFLPAGSRRRYEATQWLMWQMAGVGPMLGQVHHFVRFNQGKSDYAEARYLNEGRRLYDVLDGRLSEREFMLGDYSIVDISTWPWISRFNWQTIDIREFPNVERWYTTIASRPAVQRGYHIPTETAPIPMPGDTA